MEHTKVCWKSTYSTSKRQVNSQDHYLLHHRGAKGAVPALGLPSSSSREPY